MSIDPYAFCPCGSGKKVKWCCAPFLTQVNRAFELLREGQQESAHKLFQELLQQHTQHAALWLYYAEFLTYSEQWEQAEAALDQALQHNPQLGMAYYIRGQLRQQEGELLGALMLYHKAAELIAPEAKDQLLEVYTRIADLSYICQQYLASSYAVDRALQLRPDVPELHRLRERLFGPNTRLPRSARERYALRRTRQPIAESYITGRLSDARQGYEQLVQHTPDDPAAWFNLGLIYAWQGENQRAVEAMYRSLDVEVDDRLAEQTGTLVEVLLTARGMDSSANYPHYICSLAIRDPQRLFQLIKDKHQQGVIDGIEVNQEEGLVRGLFVEELPTLVMSEHTSVYRIRARFMIIPPEFHLISFDQNYVQSLAREFYEQSHMALEPPRMRARTPDPREMLFLFGAPVSPGQEDDAEVQRRQLQYVADYFEGTWLHQPLKSLEGNSPLEAMGSSRLRKRVFGAVRFMEECYRAVTGLPDEPAEEITAEAEQRYYNFQRLRHKLGLEYTSAAAPEAEGGVEAVSLVGGPFQQLPPEAKAGHSPSRSPSVSTPPRDINAMNIAELAALDRQDMSVDEIEQAMRAALRLEARELAVAFARAGVEKPFDPSKPDRYPLFAAAITGALVQGNYSEALELIQRGEQYDSDHNRGARAIDYALKRANVYVRMKDVDQAVKAFERIIAQYPQEGKLYTTAAEEMLRLRSADKARYFADRGLRLAHQSQNRELEEHCRELLVAAEKAR